MACAPSTGNILKRPTLTLLFNTTMHAADFRRHWDSQTREPPPKTSLLARRHAHARQIGEYQCRTVIPTHKSTTNNKIICRHLFIGYIRHRLSDLLRHFITIRKCASLPPMTAINRTHYNITYVRWATIWSIIFDIWTGTKMITDNGAQSRKDTLYML